MHGEVDCAFEGRGAHGAYTDGCVSVLAQHVELGALSGTSSGGITALRIKTAQVKAMQKSRRPYGPAFRAAFVEAFENVTDAWWDTVCTMAMFADNADKMTRFMPESVKDYWRVAGWNTQCAMAQHNNEANPLLSMIRRVMPNLRRDLKSPFFGRLVTNCYDMETGENILVDSDNDKMHAATGMVPLLFAPIDNRYCDGAIKINGPIKGVHDVETTTPLLRIALGKSGFLCHNKLYESHPRLRHLAAEAFKVVSEPLPQSRPAAEIRAPFADTPQDCILMPTPKMIDDLRAQGRRDMQAWIDAGELEALQRPWKPAAPLERLLPVPLALAA